MRGPVAAGMSDHLSKPLSPERLIRTIIDCLDGANQPADETSDLKSTELVDVHGLVQRCMGNYELAQRLLKKLELRYRDWENLIEILPGDVADILSRLKKGSFDVHLNHRHLDTTVNRLVLGILSAAETSRLS